MKINVICCSLVERKNQVRGAIEALNYVQNYFQYIYVESKKDVYKEKILVWENFDDYYQSDVEYNIYVTPKRFNDNWFSHEESNYAVISIAGWETRFAPPSLRAYIVYQIAQATMNFKADINERMQINLIHYKSKGCIFDFCANKEDIRIGMNAGIICPECKNGLRTYGVEESALSAIENILNYVRSESIAQPIIFNANTAFVVMKYTQNDENQNAFKYGIKAALKELGIKCVRADDNVRCNVILEQVIEHIHKSKFIIVKADTESLNVYFELGFAMGIKKVILLISEESQVENLPIDIRNIQCLTYKKGDYKELYDKVQKFFKKYCYNL